MLAWVSVISAWGIGIDITNNIKVIRNRSALVTGLEALVPVQGRFHTNNLEVLKQACLAHFGIAYLPRALVHSALGEGGLVALLDNYLNNHMGIYAVYPRTKQPDKKLNLLVEHLREAFLAKQAYFH